MNENMKIWDSFKNTNPKYTKKFKRSGGFSGTDISPTWRQMLMTQQFGPCGQGWGWVVERTWHENGCVFAQVNLWTRIDDGKKGFTGAHIGGTKTGTRSDDESYKMAITDAFGKCCASLGVGADIYTGQFDDSKYQREMTDHFTEVEKAASWKFSIDEVKGMCEKCDSPETLEEIRTKVRTSAPPKQAFDALKEIFSATADRLQNSQAS